VKDVVLPDSMKAAMAKQAEADVSAGPRSSTPKANTRLREDGQAPQ